MMCIPDMDSGLVLPSGTAGRKSHTHASVVFLTSASEGQYFSHLTWHLMSFAAFNFALVCSPALKHLYTEAFLVQNSLE